MDDNQFDNDYHEHARAASTTSGIDRQESY